MGVSEAAGTGDRGKTLCALRDLLAGAVESADDRYVAALAKQLRETLAELDALPVAEGKSKSDDLAARRSARRAATSRAQHPAGGGLELGDGSG